MAAPGVIAASSCLQHPLANLESSAHPRRVMRTNLTIFILFFGIALLDAIRGGHWLRSIFWLCMGTLFFLADRRQHRKSAG
jgi:hypothetical protein